MEELKNAAETAAKELLGVAKLQKGDLFVLGCSTSEVAGRKIGTQPGPELAAEILQGLLPPLQQAGVYLAVQCCEHLNRALVVPQAAMRAHDLQRVNAVPQPKAGGSAATAAWQVLEEPVLVQNLLGKGAAGLDVGHTLIGMHLRPVVVPVRLATEKLGEAPLVAARTRPPFVGGERAVYDEDIM